MKQRYLYRICAAVAPLLAWACGSESTGTEECLPCGKVRTVEVRLAEALPAAELAAPLYVFRRPAGTQEDYRLARSYPDVADGQALKIPLAEFAAYDFRFLMVAQPADGAWLTLRTADGGPYAPGAAWQELRLTSATGAAALDGYCGFTDIGGPLLLSEGKVRLTLTRVAGRALFDFFRIDGSVDRPVGVVSADVASVLDRVARIEIAYGQPTTELRFDDTGALVPAAYAAEPLVQTIEPALTDFKVALPQSGLGLVAYDPALRGSLRIEGACLLPSDARLRVRMTFTYYDTTPKCDNKHEGAHSASCFELRQVTLDLPKSGSTTGLPVAADFHTVSRAGLRCDRIIDIPASGGIVMNFDWL